MRARSIGLALPVVMNYMAFLCLNLRFSKDLVLPRIGIGAFMGRFKVGDPVGVCASLIMAYNFNIISTPRSMMQEIL